MKLNYKDFCWSISLFGTAVGAGILFLPMTAGAGGFWSLVIVALVTAPMTWFAHKNLARFVLSSEHPEADITHTVEEHFGKKRADIIRWTYFFAIYPIVMIYGVGITNTAESFLIHQLNIDFIPRWLLSGSLIALMTVCVMFERDFMLKVTSILVYPLVLILLGLSLYLIPDWNSSIITVQPDWHIMPTTIWLTIPTIVFAFNHSPIISQFAKEQRRIHGDNAIIKTDKITGLTATMLMIFVMFFVFSVVLSTTPQQLADARAENISILSYLGNTHHSPIISILGPIVAFTAIVSSYFGHFLGTHEGLVGILKSNTMINSKVIDKLSLGFIILTTWIAAIVNPSILGTIEIISAPMIATILFIMPVYAMYKVPALSKYKTSFATRLFTMLCGAAVISSVLFSISRL